MPSPCADCGTDTAPPESEPGTWEWYAVTGETWAEAGMGARGFLCVGCLEARLGRELRGADFEGVPVNVPNLMPDTPRMADRKSRPRLS